MALPLQAKTERTEFNLVADGRLYTYNNSAFSHNDGKLDASLKDVGELATVVATADWTRDTTLTSELGMAGLTDVKKRHQDYGKRPVSAPSHEW